jgi:MFS transporter, DHA1 family, inner membrane transport protein
MSGPADTVRAMKRLMAVVGVIAFATALFGRAVDPNIPPIARDLGVNAETVALLSTAFALPFALIQPILGPLADMLGKTRVMTVCLAILVAAGFAGALAPSFEVLLVSRIIAGVAAGGIFPIALALVGDLVPVGERQVALGRYLAFVISGTLVGTTFAGFVGDLAGWRTVLVAVAIIGVLALVAAIAGFRAVVPGAPARIELGAIPAAYRTIFANPRSKVCFTAVFLEGMVVFGVFPYVALLLLERGEGRASIAGLVLAGFAVGGVGFALVTRLLVSRLRPSRLMMVGGGSAALALVGAGTAAAWPVELLNFVLLGFGFYMLHSCIQVQATELAPKARGVAMALHSFSFFLGQAVGPVLYGLALAHGGPLLTLAAGAAIILLVGIICARLLGDRTIPE